MAQCIDYREAMNKVHGSQRTGSGNETKRIHRIKSVEWGSKMSEKCQSVMKCEG